MVPEGRCEERCATAVEEKRHEPGCTAGGGGLVKFRQVCGVAAWAMEWRRGQERKTEGEKNESMKSGGPGGVLGGPGCQSPTWLLFRLPQSLHSVLPIYQKIDKLIHGPMRGGDG